MIDAPESPPAGPPNGATSPPGAARPSGPWGRRLTATREQVFAVFFFGAFLFLLYQLYLVFSPFFAPIVWAAILAMVCYPLYQLVLRGTRGRATLAALALTMLATAAVVVPTVSLSSVVTQQAAGFYAQLTEYARSGRLQAQLDRIRDSRLGLFVRTLDREGWEIDYGRLLQRTADATSGVIVAQATAVARNVAVFLLHFSIMVFTLFFFFRDGERMYRGLRELIPMDPVHKDAVFGRLYDTLSAVVRGMIVTALAQGILAWVGLWALDLPFAALLGVLAACASFVPFAGAALVWVPCTLYLATTGEPVRAVILLAYGTLVISMVDNVVRPLVIGGRTRLPTLLLFFGILGGLEAYGVLGVFLGPVLVAIVVAFVNIYREQYAAAEPRPLAPPVV